jgi:hypothetical protein
MDRIWVVLVTWWQGKNTSLGGMLVVAAGVAGVWYGKLDAVDGLTLVGVGLSIAGFSAKANRHQAELLTALQGVGQIGADMRTGNRVAAIQTAEQAGATLLPAGVTYLAGVAANSSPAATLHLSAATVQELAMAVQHLAGNIDALPPVNEAGAIPIGGPAK